MALLVPAIIASLALLDKGEAPFCIIALAPLGLSLVGLGIYVVGVQFGALFQLLLPVVVMGSFLWARRCAEGAPSASKTGSPAAALAE